MLYLEILIFDLIQIVYFKQIDQFCFFFFIYDCNYFDQNIIEERNASIDRIQKPDSDEVSRIILTADENQTKLIIEKKEFDFHDDHDTYFIDNVQKVP